MGLLVTCWGCALVIGIHDEKLLSWPKGMEGDEEKLVATDAGGKGGVEVVNWRGFQFPVEGNGRSDSRRRKDKSGDARKEQQR